MRLIHLSDIHLGFRQYQRQTGSGINQREADVAATLRRVIDRIIELEPDLVLVAGDVFHTVRPTNPAILHAFTQFSRLVQMLPDTPIVIVAGNHDTPRTTETGCILRLFSPLGIYVVEGKEERIPLFGGEVSVLAVPDMAAGRPALTPVPSAKHNILLLHGEIEGVLPRYASTLERVPMEISRADLGAERWDYVALGHYHVHRSVAPNAFYSGSLDYTSSNPWGELSEERDEAGPEAETDDQERRDRLRVAQDLAVNEEDPGDAEQAQRDDEEAGHRAAAQGDGDRLLQAAGRRRGRPHVGPDGDVHSDVTGESGAERAEQERDRSEEAFLPVTDFDLTVGHVAVGEHDVLDAARDCADQHSDGHSGHQRQDRDRQVLAPQERHRA